jgi:hypothetical protein
MRQVLEGLCCSIPKYSSFSRISDTWTSGSLVCPLGLSSSAQFLLMREPKISLQYTTEPFASPETAIPFHEVFALLCLAYGVTTFVDLPAPPADDEIQPPDPALYQGFLKQHPEV